ncbi:MAG TPA: helix-turn-helix domain-containing protein [Phycisphaerae bacterium]|nr:helix-turn-helix domain-containing protein [Phycisphaerae bacterium]
MLRQDRNETLLTKVEVCQRLKFSSRKLNRLVAARQIPALRAGRHLRFRASDIDRYIDTLPAA